MITTIRPNKMPTFWWLFPWAYAQTLHMSANALKAYADRLEDILDLQRRTMAKQAADIKLLQARVRDQDDAIIKGTAITPDATPYRDETIHE
jgi:hypothetical protein